MASLTTGFETSHQSLQLAKEASERLAAAEEFLITRERKVKSYHKENATKIYNESTSTSALVQSDSLPEFTEGKQVRKVKRNVFFNELIIIFSGEIFCKTGTNRKGYVSPDI